MDKLLTIIIATYNRKEGLLRQLHSIYNQKESSEVEIVICDNHSDYDVDLAIREEFSQEIASNLEVITNEQNLGMGANLALMLLKSKTPWFWTLSDDDVTHPNSIRNILKTINDHPDVGFIKFSMVGKYPNDDSVVESLEGLCDFYYKSKHIPGELIFISNNVYNKSIIDKYYGLTLGYSYCLIPQLLPAFFALEKHDIKVLLSSESVVEAMQNGGWNILKGTIGMSVISTMPFALSYKNRKKLVAVTMGNCNHIRILCEALEWPDRRQGKFMYEMLYKSCFRLINRIYDPVLNVMFHVCYHLRINPKLLIGLYPKVQNNKVLGKLLTKQFG